MLTNVLLALVLSAAIALATGPKLIEWLRGHQMKTSENELGPKEHLKKRGTPIMGGLMIALGCIVSFVLCAAYTGRRFCRCCLYRWGRWQSVWRTTGRRQSSTVPKG